MSLIEIKHTFAVIDKIKKDLTKFLKIISIIGFIVFFFYYIYLIYTNYKYPFYLVTYSILFITLLSTIPLEVLFKMNASDSQKKQRIKLERKRLFKNIIKFVKYLIKIITIFIAIYEMLQYGITRPSLITNIISIGILILQMMVDFIVHYLTKYIDYLKLSIELDIKESTLARLVMRKKMKSEKLENQVSAMKGIEVHTNQENKIINNIKESAEILKKEKKEKLNSNIEKNKLEIRKHKQLFKKKN